MWRTRDGDAVTMPQFRMRRLQRRLRARRGSSNALGALSRTLELLFGRARRAGRLPAAKAGETHPQLTSSLGRTRVVILTRALAPRRLEVLYIGRARSR